MPESDPIIRLAGVNKWFGHFHVLKDIDLEVAQAGGVQRARVLAVDGLSDFHGDS